MHATQPKTLIITLVFLWVGLFSTTTLADVSIQRIENNFSKLESFAMGYFVDKMEEMPFEEIQNQRFQESSNSLSLGTSSKTTWAKIKLENTTSTPFIVYLHHSYAYHNRAVDLYEVVNERLVQRRLLDMDDKTTQKWMYRGSSVFDIKLQPHQPKTLYIKSLSYSHQWFALNLYGEDQSKRALLGQYTDIAILVGMLLALVIYNFFLFMYSRLKEHLFYSAYLVSGGLWIAFSYGLFADVFNVFGAIAFKLHLSLATMPIFLLLFMMTVFETKKKYPIEHWALLSILILLVIDFFYGFFDIVNALKYATILAGIMMLISFSVSISMVIRKHVIAPFFLIGHGLFIIFGTISILFYNGKVEFNYINSHGVGIGIVLEALVLSLIIAYRIKTLNSLKETQTELQLQASTDPLTQP